MNPFDIHSFRETALQEIAEGVHCEGICITITPQGEFRDDGDDISARSESHFLEHEDEDKINIRFQRGVSHKTMVRVLRKCAELFESPDGSELANLAYEQGEISSAFLLPNGKVYFCKSTDDYLQYLKLPL